MPQVSYEQRMRVVEIYKSNDLHFQKGRFSSLKILSERESILASDVTLRRIINQWNFEGSIENKKPVERNIANTKITNGELAALDRFIYKNRDLSAGTAKISLNLLASVRTVQKYLNRLGWKKITTRYCQFVRPKNKIERVIYCKLCIISGERFFFSIHIDECTVSMDKNGKTQWFRSFPGETKSGVVGKYKHPATINIIGGISRSGPTKLMVYKGETNSTGFQELADEFLIPFIKEKYPKYHRLHMDNAPFHTSADSLKWLAQKQLNHYKTPAQSPDLNPIGKLIRKVN